MTNPGLLWQYPPSLHIYHEAAIKSIINQLNNLSVESHLTLEEGSSNQLKQLGSLLKSISADIDTIGEVLSQVHAARQLYCLLIETDYHTYHPSYYYRLHPAANNDHLNWVWIILEHYEKIHACYNLRHDLQYHFYGRIKIQLVLLAPRDDPTPKQTPKKTQPKKRKNKNDDDRDDEDDEDYEEKEIKGSSPTKEEKQNYNKKAVYLPGPINNHCVEENYCYFIANILWINETIYYRGEWQMEHIKKIEAGTKNGTNKSMDQAVIYTAPKKSDKLPWPDCLIREARQILTKSKENRFGSYVLLTSPLSFQSTLTLCVILELIIDFFPNLQPDDWRNDRHWIIVEMKQRIFHLYKELEKLIEFCDADAAYTQGEFIGSVSHWFYDNNYTETRYPSPYPSLNHFLHSEAFREEVKTKANGSAPRNGAWLYNYSFLHSKLSASDYKREDEEEEEDENGDDIVADLNMQQVPTYRHSPVSLPVVLPVLPPEEDEEKSIAKRMNGEVKRLRTDRQESSSGQTVNMENLNLAASPSPIHSPINLPFPSPPHPPSSRSSVDQEKENKIPEEDDAKKTNDSLHRSVSGGGDGIGEGVPAERTTSNLSFLMNNGNLQNFVGHSIASDDFVGFGDFSTGQIANYGHPPSDLLPVRQPKSLENYRHEYIQKLRNSGLSNLHWYQPHIQYGFFKWLIKIQHEFRFAVQIYEISDKEYLRYHLCKERDFDIDLKSLIQHHEGLSTLFP